MGYDRNGMGYRIASLPGFRIRTALHITFVEDVFPCKTTIAQQLGSFLTADQEKQAAVDQIDLEPRQRQARERVPSAAALKTSRQATHRPLMSF